MTAETNVYISENYTVMTSEMLIQQQNREANGALALSPKALRSVDPKDVGAEPS
jgi:hypothetical protein